MSESHVGGAAYHNRFRTSSSDGGDSHAAITSPQLRSVSEHVDFFGHSPHLSPLSTGRGSVDLNHSDRFLRLANSDQHPAVDLSGSGHWGGAGPAPHTHGDGVRQSTGDAASRPTAPGMPRRMSRQSSVDARRQLFAASKSASGEGCGKHVVTSADSGCDDVFVEVGGEAGGHHHHHHPTPHDSSLFPSKRTAELTFSTSSTASILPNPYNRVNHRIHSVVWCCSCLYFVFFCCLPAIHYMEQCDVEFNRNNQKRARCLGRTSSFLFFTGTLVTLSAFALIFFLAIFFAVY